MADAITLQLQGKDIEFTKSERLGAVRARAGMDTAMRDDIERIAPGFKEAERRMIGAFDIIDLEGSENGIEQDLDWLRSRPAVAVATHVFQILSTGTLYVPNGNIHLILNSRLTGHAQQAILNRYRLQTIENRGSGDFLVSITAGSKNPITTAADLQLQTMVEQAEPEFVAV